jgi:DNA-binding beta-propeller fold protein YncE
VTLLASSAFPQVLEGTILLPDSLGPLTGETHVVFDESPAHPRMFIGSKDGNVLVVNSLSGARVERIQTGPVQDLCYSPVRNKLYVSATNPYGFLVIDCSSYQVTRQLPMPYVTTGLLYNPLIDRVYGATWGMRVIDCATDSIVDSLPMYTKDAKLALDATHNKLYIGAVDTFRVLDCNHDSVVARMRELRKPRAICYQPTAGKVYVAAGESLFAIDTKFDSVLYSRKFDTLNPQLACDPVHNRVFYTYWGGVIALDCSNDTAMWSQYLSCQAVGLAVEPEQGKLYMLLRGLGSGFPYALDGATGQTLREFHWSDDNSLCYSAAVNRAFFIWNGGEATAIDCNADTIVAVTPLAPQIINACLDSVDSKLYFSVGKSGVGIVDCTTNKVESYLRASKRLRYLAYDSRDNKLYCSSDSSILVLDCGADTFVKEIPIRGRARTMNWLPTLNKLYAIASADTERLVIMDCGADTVIRALYPVNSDCSTLLSPELNQLWLIVAGRLKMIDCNSDSMVMDSSSLLYCRSASYDPSNHRLYAGCDESMQVIDMDTRLPVHSLPMPLENGWSYGVHCAARAGKAYWTAMRQAPYNSDTVVAVDTRTDSIVSKFAVPWSSVGVCDDRSGDYVYFSGYREIVVADARTDSIVSGGGLPVSTQFLIPDRTTNRLYIVGSTDSMMQVVYDSAIFSGLQATRSISVRATRLQTLLNRGAPLRSPTDAVLFDASGRRAAILKTGPNDISHLAPGVYFIREGLGTRGEGLGKTRKVVVTR